MAIVCSFTLPSTFWTPVTRRTAMRMVITQPSQVMPGTLSRTVSIDPSLVAWSRVWCIPSGQQQAAIDARISAGVDQGSTHQHNHQRRHRLDPASPDPKGACQGRSRCRPQEGQQEDQQSHGDGKDQESQETSEEPSDADGEDRDRGQKRSRSTETH